MVLFCVRAIINILCQMAKVVVAQSNLTSSRIFIISVCQHGLSYIGEDNDSGLVEDTDVSKTGTKEESKEESMQ